MTEIRTDPSSGFVNGRREPTQAMLDYVRHIEIWSKVPADATVWHDFWSCHDYISANRAEAQRAYSIYMASRYQERRQSRRVTEFIGGDYGIGNNDWGVSCFDYGIYPWGDS